MYHRRTEVYPYTAYSQGCEFHNAPYSSNLANRLNILSNAPLNAVYRETAQKVCLAFRTAPENVIFVIAGMMLIDTLAVEMANRLTSLLCYR